jgi:hypothetical protein
MSVQESLDPVSPHYWRPDTAPVREAEAALEKAMDARSRAWADDNDEAVFEHMRIVAASTERLRQARLDAIEHMFV